MQKNYVLGIINQIEKQLCSDKKIESVYPASRTKMYLDFISAVGYTPNEYARRRRLSVALSMLAASEESGTAIAYACGYSSHQALCREVKALLGMTVKEYKKSNVQYYFPPYEDQAVLPVIVMQCTIPRTVELIYFSTKLTDMEDRATELFLRQNPAYTGRLFGRNGKQIGTKFSYVLFAEKTGTELHTDGFLVSGARDGYTTTAAIISVANIEKEINGAWDEIYYSWLPVSMYRYAGADSEEFSCQYFEEYLYKNGKFSPYRLKLYVPLVRREGFHKLSLMPYQAQFLTCTETGTLAEKEASERIIRHLTMNYPYALVKPVQLLLITNGISCTCGMRISNHLMLENEDFKSIRIHALCAVLEMDDICDPDELKMFLNQWMRDNRLHKKQEPFLVYIAKDSGMKMQLICPVNPV